jgi:hypothetical protein
VTPRLLAKLYAAGDEASILFVISSCSSARQTQNWSLDQLLRAERNGARVNWHTRRTDMTRRTGLVTLFVR